MKNTATWFTTRCLRRPNISQRVYCLLALVLIGWTAGPIRAIEVTWTGSVNSNWSNGGNWSVGKPLTGDSVVFPNTGQTSVRADFSSYPETDPQAADQPALHLNSVTFAPGAPAYAIELYTSAETSLFYQANVTYDGPGVTNSSGVMQNFVIDHGGFHAEANEQYTGIDGSQLIFNNSSSAGSNVTYHAQGGVTTLTNTFEFLRTGGGSILFNNSAPAGGATLIADGGIGNGGLPARVEFHDTSTAASGIFTSNGGVPGGNPPGQFPPIVCGFGGETIFFDHANAGTAHFTVNGTSGSGGSGGLTLFTQNSSADHGVFVTNPAADSHVGSGIVQFLDSARADHGNFTNSDGPVSTSNGFTQFWDTTDAEHAVIENLGGSATYGGTTIFHDHATAGTDTTAPAVINNRGMSGGGSGGMPGTTSFYDDSKAGTAIIHNWPGPDTGGATEFHGNSTAANAHIIVEPGNIGGTIVFDDNSSAGSAHLDASADNTSGLIDFKGHSTAANADIALGASPSNLLKLRFKDDSSAGSATISVGLFSFMEVDNNSTANNANITMASDSRLTFTGSFDGAQTASADHAAIHLQGGANAGATGAAAAFRTSSTAADALIIVDGAMVDGGVGATIVFSSYADAGHAVILLKSAAVSGNPGGLLTFGGGASGPLARVYAEAGSLINVVTNSTDYGFSGTSIGSIEGAGTANLGNSTLTVGALGLNTTFSGPITGQGGSLIKTGTGMFMLTGTNTYTGVTTVENGTLSVNGSVAGGADAKSGATLKGTVHFAGMVICENGSICSPGNSPGTFTLPGLNLMSGSTLQFELGATRDHIVVTNSGTVTISGRLDLSVLPGFNPALGQTFSLFEGSIGSITGAFSAVNAPIFNGKAMNLVYGTNQVMLVVGDAGDFNGDGTVNAADYIVWRKRLGTQDEYNAWRTHFGQSVAAGSGSGAIAKAAVPEPATLVLLIFAAAGLCLRRRRAA